MFAIPARILKRMLDMPQNGVQKIFAKMRTKWSREIGMHVWAGGFSTAK